MVKACVTSQYALDVDGKLITNGIFEGKIPDFDVHSLLLRRSFLLRRICYRIQKGGIGDVRPRGEKRESSHAERLLAVRKLSNQG